jgi:excinuclease UvrABC nuclease subunit
LLREFGSLQKIQEASPEELRQVEPLTQKDTQTIFAFFHPALSPSSPPEGIGE